MCNNERKNYLKVVLFIAILLNGCRDKVVITSTDEIKKNNPVSIESVDTILKTFFKNNSDGERRISLHFIDEQNISNQYLIHFNFMSRLHKNEPTRRNMPIVIQLCEEKFEYKDILEYPVFSNTLPPATSDIYEHDVIFSIDELKRYHFIADNSIEQKDLCLYRNDVNFGHTGITVGSETREYITSNALVYSAEEINAIKVEYESLTQ